MKIVSYNVNGIRAAIKKGFLEWMKEVNADIICIQETKAHPEQVDLNVFEQLGYHHHWVSAQKKGYSGVATFSKKAPKSVESGMGLEKYDSEGRVLITHFDQFSLINSYFPSGSSGEERHAFKMEYLHDIRSWIDQYRKQHNNLILVGDYNIVHTEKDIHNPNRKDKPSGYRPEERQWLTEWFDSGFVDAFRYLHNDALEYSWWSYRAGSRAKNKGWRIDYISVPMALKGHISAAGHMPDAKHSDHCPVFVELDL